MKQTPREMVVTVLLSRPHGEFFEDQMCNGIWAALMKVDVRRC